MDGTEPERLLSGRYRLTSVVGRGGMGVVWRGYDELLHREVAVKEISWPDLSDDEQRLASRRAVREAQVAGRLSHQNVVRIYDIVEADGHPSIVMEYLPYRSLRDLVADDGPLPPARVAEIGLGVLAALRAAHAEGILHLDVKPANILIGPDGRVVLTDFGLARAADSTRITSSGVLLGSPSFIAPERARGLPSAAIGAPADLWGLGASLYTAVEGHPPFRRDGVLATLTAVVADEPDEPGQAGPLRPVISALLRKDPEERLGADEAETMLRQVVDAAAGEPPGEVQPAADSGPPAADTGTAAAARGGPPGGTSSGLAAGTSSGLPAGTEPAATVPRGRRRRARLAGLVVVLAAVAAGLTALALSLSSGPGRQAAAPGSTPTPRQDASAARPAATGTSASAPSPSAPSGRSSTAPTAAGTSAVGTSAGGSASVPAGYRRYTDATGFSIALPDGWQVHHSGHYVYLADPASASTYLLIDQSSHPNPDPLANWRQQAANRAAGYPDYRLIRLVSVSYPQAEKAADWEFTYDDRGVPVHILNRNVLANATHAYALYWSTPAGDWAADYHYFQVLAATFRPAR